MFQATESHVSVVVVERIKMKIFMLKWLLGLVFYVNGKPYKV